ncbi:hypothetical protein R69746_07756 [Paraburkholderia aspalathi]|uniref:hypothetical protein n=1 Tax=Paraburkholderia aspalathi TaxID=1324617 RepID=UPI00190A7C35|nr:hypothetical protein [Paraburkholderia aspalathi]MBK3843740.1 hypothetical protein [Paraburkholderia aspalathi]CAE6859745.1 hypothetical protein R69746_07756 [Paraburkholderia aspalathi]
MKKLLFILAFSPILAFAQAGAFSSLSVTASGAVGNPGTSADLAQMYAGSASAPVADINPTVAISRYEAVNQDGQGGQNAAVYVQDTANNTSTSSINAQVNGITSNVIQNGTGDSVAVYGSSVNNSTGQAHTAFGGFFYANSTGAGDRSFGLEVDSSNATGSDVAYTGLSPYPGMVGIHVQALGSKLNTAGIWVGNAAGAPLYDVGVAFTAGSVKTSAIEDDSADSQILMATGTHGWGINWSSATFSSGSILVPGLIVSPIGSIKSYVLPTAAWTYDATGNGISISSGSSAVIASGNGVVYLEDSVQHNMAEYFCSNGACAMVASFGAVWVASTSSPALGHMSVAWNGSSYAIFNNEGATETVTAALTKLNSTN